MTKPDITPGVAVWDNRLNIVYVRSQRDERLSICGAVHNRADGEFIVEALNIHTETGLTPRQLLGQRDELAGAARDLLARLSEFASDHLSDDNATDWMGQVEPVMQRLEGLAKLEAE